ncbi:MAG: DinB family protein [Planctomycetes bacterium]|nr:DinB family protein [Planctomycetota bacterium]
MNPQVRVLLEIVDEAFAAKSWHGTNLKGSIRGLTIDAVTWRPQPRRHNIWEIVLHAAYWKYTVHRRLVGEQRGSFPLTGSNWFARPLLGVEPGKQWKSDVSLLVVTHGSLREAISQLSDRDLERPANGGQTRVGTLVRGIAAHDLYHAGQIQLLKRMYADRQS